MPASRLAVLLGVPLAALGLAALPAAAAAHAPNPARHAPAHLLGKDSQSDNWAGYAVDGATDAFTSVSATFTLPKVSCTSEGDTSFWVGLDGDTSDTVEQIGASGDCDGSTPDYYAWWEMYPAGVNTISDTAKPGDVFAAKVSYTGSGKYTLYLQDKTQGWTVTKNEKNSSAKDNSAEVVFEAAGPTTDLVPKFSPVAMSDSTVDGTYLGSDSPTAIDLVRNGHTLVTPGSIGSTGQFTFTWHAAS